MRKGFCLILIVGCMFLCGGCDSDHHHSPNNYTDLKGGLEITEVYAPGGYCLLRNDIPVKLFQPTLKIYFNKPLVDDDYILGNINSGIFLAITKEPDSSEHRYFYYKIQDNYIEIYATEQYYNYGINAFYLPKELKAKDGSSLNESQMLFFTLGYSDTNVSLNVNSFISRESKSLILSKNKDDGKKYAVINYNCDLKLANNSSSVSPNIFNLVQGDNVEIINELDSEYEVKIYFNREELDSMKGIFENYREQFKEESNHTISLSGSTLKDCLFILPEPINKGISYDIRMSCGHDTADPALFILNPYGKYNSIFLEFPIKVLNSNDLLILESLTLLDTDSYEKGSSYLCAPYNYNNEQCTINDRESHMPEVCWSEQILNHFLEAYQLYLDYYKKCYNNSIIDPSLNSFRDELINELYYYHLFEVEWKKWGFATKDNNFRDGFEVYLEAINKELKKCNPLSIELISFSYDTYYNDMQKLINRFNSSHVSTSELFKQASNRYGKIFIQAKVIEKKSVDIFVIKDTNSELEYTIKIDDDVALSNTNINVDDKVTCLLLYNFDDNLYHVCSDITKDSDDVYTTSDPPVEDNISDANEDEQIIVDYGEVIDISEDYIITIKNDEGNVLNIKIIDNAKSLRNVDIGDRVLFSYQYDENGNPYTLGADVEACR
ncbi:hypothetical protein JYG23_03500 [Sedimentibacter sp. zth1]|uniref:hypothetical protein n=1 Tax=Sedimentibacter sp. zth1 TaxID=2816908 RepID=UPI001A91AFD7|nr:hypothetical protein [Sedimentibacter sp. zth1]QSX06534.1 hypothetical protein JYG23_03500 [Sedimentibacter sp. zth1]